jgi:hypothetical protein
MLMCTHQQTSVLVSRKQMKEGEDGGEKLS